MMAETKKEAPIRYAVVGITGLWWEVPHCQRVWQPPSLAFGSPFHAEQEPDCAACSEGSLVLLDETNPEKAISFACERDRDPAIQSARPPKATWIRHIKIEDATPGPLQRLFAAFIPESLVHYIAPVSRGLEPQLEDGVLPLSGETIDLGAALRDMEPGTYQVRFQTVRGGSSLGPVPVRWAGDNSAKVTIPGLHWGLYKIEQLNPNGQKVGVDAWVLISSPADFEKSYNTYQQALDATRRWPNDVDARASKAFLRSILDGLHQQTQNSR